MTSPLAIAQSTTADANAGVQPGSSFGAEDFANEQAAVTTAPEENFHNTALSAADEDRIVGDVVSAGSYTDITTTLSAATAAGETLDGDTTGASVATTTPVVLAAAAACVVAIGAIAIVKKGADKRVWSPHTPVDKSIYYHVEVQTLEKKRGFFHANRQLTPPTMGSTIV